MVTQFIAAFDDVVISRYNKDREEQDQINVRYIYAPKQRVLHDIINLNKTLTLPAISVNISGISRDSSRVFNKLDGFYYQGKSGDESVSKHVKSPIPVNITLKVSIISKYQTDMDQIISNFVPFCNPYVVISWKVPEAFKLSVGQEIRSEVLWDGSVAVNYPTELTSSQKARVTADTTFTIKGWLFKDTTDPAGNIHFIDQNFHNESKLEYYDNFDSLSGNSYTYPLSSGIVNEVETFTLSGNPNITDVFFKGVQLHEDLQFLSDEFNGPVQLNGYGFNNTQHVLLSSTDTTLFTTLTTISGFDRQSPITGILIPFNIVNDNTISLNLSARGNIESDDDVFIRLIPFNNVGYSFSDLSYYKVDNVGETPTTFFNLALSRILAFGIEDDYVYTGDVIGTKTGDAIIELLEE